MPQPPGAGIGAWDVGLPQPPVAGVGADCESWPQPPEVVGAGAGADTGVGTGAREDEVVDLPHDPAGWESDGWDPQEFPGAALVVSLVVELVLLREVAWALRLRLAMRSSRFLAATSWRLVFRLRRGGAVS